MKGRQLRFPGAELVRLCLPLLLAGGLAGCVESGADSGVEAHYHPATSVQPRLQQGYQVARTFIGRVEVRQSASLGFELGGKVAEVMVDEGDSVALGQVLARQDTELLQAEASRLEAEGARLDAELALVKTSIARQQSLQQRGYASDQQLDELKARRRGLEASLLGLDAERTANRLRIEKSTLRAPFEARVGRRLLDQGEVVAAGTPVLELLEAGAAEVRVGVPADLLERLPYGSRQSLSIGGKEYSARVLAHGSDVDPVTLTVPLRLVLDGESGPLNGQLAQLSLEQHYPVPGYWVPLEALTDAPRGMWNLYSLQETADAGLYELRSHNVRVLHATSEQAYVSGELGADVRVLSAGLQRLVPGQRVRLASGGELADATP
ncbi:RND transporter MFP subunit [Marinobacterium nitratireducens]|uniref:RND transporter MFP subunit n=1 Tax=Marinobacterium nitratireducens TaxID=518897 RepID=A0A918DVC4_9GAMM|nr:efflux RND transporter periplasmic adaptor subunit [Marinobacterium nitratireducens]GGO83519.1 RND transporter MFP subunit [Marinobacterium nitratireducens]